MEAEDQSSKLKGTYAVIKAWVLDLYELELERICKIVEIVRARRVLVQMPDGLKRYAINIMKFLQDRLPHVLLMFSSSKSYGSCDIAFDEAMALNADLIVHLGHTPRRYEGPIPVIYIPCYSKVRPLKSLEELSDRLKDFKIIGLSSVVQHENLLSEVREALEREGFKVIIGNDPRLPPGVVVGCDYTQALSIDSIVEAHLIIAGGLFHAIGLLMLSKRPVFLLDPYRDVIVDVEKEYRRLLSIKLSVMCKALEAKTFGIIVCLKSGQFSLSRALEAKRLLEEKGYEALIIVMRDVDPALLEGFSGIDVFINTCCPRLSFDDLEAFRRPLITLYDLQFILRKELDKYVPRIR
ncbi:MAG: diphthamide biosynthesis enzyme Dph2 [Thermoprotei archaeon]|nr:MAG: diphthamide biosynthesis enzyme Dph2 [Thermoprotei archaeon]RLF25355.1 MAG: diphthamide biosynthesis enzyme Dph2 [Thermoprotei archaeon]